MSNDLPLDPAPGSFVQTWVRALTRPREATYAVIASSPRAKAGTAFLWVFLCSLAPALASVLVRGGQLTQQLAQAGVDTEQLGGGFGAALVNLLCITPFVALAGVLGFIIGTALVNWVAKMFGGSGSYGQLAYTLGAITAPGLLVSAILTLPAAVPFLGLCVAGLSALFSLYLVVLQVIAIKGVHRFGWGAAIGAYVIPGLALALICFCAAAILISITGLALGDVFSTINQSLVP